jgi:predicted ATPase
MKRYILTGTPGSGKTSLLHALKSRRYVVVEEAATDVNIAEHRRGNPEPWMLTDFIDKIVQLQKLRQREAMLSTDDLQVYDRSPICTYALSRYLGYPPSACLLAELERIERENIYQREVFFLEHLGFCQPTEVRKITFEESLLFEKIHADIYTALGYHLIKVPPEALLQRVDLVEELLKTL